MPSEIRSHSQACGAGRHGASRDQGDPIEQCGVIGMHPELKAGQQRRAARGGQSDAVPDEVMHLVRLQLGKRDAGPGENLARVGADDGDGGEFLADVGDFDVIHDDMAVEEFAYPFDLIAVGRKQEIIAAIVGDQIALDASLGIQDEAVIPLVQRQVPGIVGDHPIQPAGAVLAGENQFGAPAQVQNRAAAAQRPEFVLRVGEGQTGPRRPRKPRIALRSRSICR